MNEYEVLVKHGDKYISVRERIIRCGEWNTFRKIPIEILRKWDNLFVIDHGWYPKGTGPLRRTEMLSRWEIRKSDGTHKILNWKFPVSAWTSDYHWYRHSLNLVELGKDWVTLSYEPILDR